MTFTQVNPEYAFSDLGIFETDALKSGLLRYSPHVRSHAADGGKTIRPEVSELDLPFTRLARR
jgi:hypothetical protein